MKLFNIYYTNKEYEGTAVVAACSANKASLLLQSAGRLNSGKYKCQSILEIGCSDYPAERIVSEAFSRISRPEPSTPEPGNPVFDITSLTKEEIAVLREKLNDIPLKNKSIIYVDRIGSLSRANPDNGYSVFVTEENSGIIKPLFEVTDLTGKAIPAPRGRIGYLYIFKEGKYTELGKVPSGCRVLNKGKSAYVYTGHNGEVVVNVKKVTKPKLGLYKLYKSSDCRKFRPQSNKFKRMRWSWMSNLDARDIDASTLTLAKDIAYDLILKNTIPYVSKYKWKPVGLRSSVNKETGVHNVWYLYKFCIAERGYKGRMKGFPLHTFTLRVKETFSERKI